MTVKIILLSTILGVALHVVEVLGQSGSNSNNCSRIFRGVRRSGANVVGRLDIPTDDKFPKFQLRLKFSRPINSLAVRQLRALNVGARREFLIDPTTLNVDGIMRIGTSIRLPSIFGPAPRLLGVSYNGRLLCGGENTYEDGVLVELKTTTLRSIPILQVTNKPSFPPEDEEEVFS